MSKAFIPILKELDRALAHLEIITRHHGQLNDLARSLGWVSNLTADDFVAIKNSVGLIQVVNDIRDIVKQVLNEEGDILDNIEIGIEKVKSLFTTIRAFASISGISSLAFPYDQSDFWQQLADELPNRLLVHYLRKNNPELYSVLRMLGIIQVYQVNPGTSMRVTYEKSDFRFDNIKPLLTTPTDYIKNVYGWGTTFQYVLFQQTVTDILKALRLTTSLRRPYQALADPYFTETQLEQDVDLRSLQVLFFDGLTRDGSSYMEFGLDILPIPTIPLSGDAIDGFALVPVSRGMVQGEFNISQFLSYRLSSALDLTGVFNYLCLPSGNQFVSSIPSSEFEAAFELIYKNEDPYILFGAKDETRIEVPSAKLSFEILGPLNDPEFTVSLGTAEDGTLPLMSFYFEPSQGDGFLSKIFGTESQSVDFDAMIRWSSKHGLGLNGGAGFSFLIPIHRSIGPLKFGVLRISAQEESAGSSISAAVDVNLTVGPLNLNVEGIGAKLRFLDATNSSSPGIFDGLDLDWSFKAPTGVGITINSPTITGGGFLNFDEATKTYTGALELSFKKFSLSAFGIISTQLPDGSEGYSLLIFITAQFQPIQIGMGFTLTGVGGLLGLHRSTNIEYLRTGIRDNTLNNILFPTNIVTNAPAIISTVNQAFPIQEGRFVFGPMAKIGWGTPTIMTMDLGIVIEVPDPVTLVILGVMRSILPDIEKQTLKLQVNFLGIIDFDKKQLSFDASIYDSKLLSFVLSGDLALRIAWGDTPNFLLSVGGFHPSYTPPPLNLPELRRISVQIFNEENLRARFECYFALTSNSAQFGAKLEAYAAAGNYNVSALLWFDLLFKFSPFHMLLNMGVEVALRRKQKVLFAAHLDISIEGPGPWRVWGMVSFNIAGANLSIDFDKTFGEGAMEVNLPVYVLAKLNEAIDAKGNWIAEFPERNHLLVALRDLQLPEATLLAEPFGNLTFRQQVLPFNITFNKYGNAPLGDYKRFEIVNVRDFNNVPVAAQTVTDFFASSEYYYLSDSDRLSKPSYERFNSGVTISGTGTLKSSYFVHKEFLYEEALIDMRQRAPLVSTPVPPLDFDAQLFGNAIAASPLSVTQVALAHNAPARVNITTQQFTLANTDDFSVYGSTPVYFSSETEAEAYLESLIASNNLLQNQLIVVNELEFVA